MALVKTIIAYNGEHYIEKCIASVLNSSIQTDIIIMIITLQIIQLK